MNAPTLNRDYHPFHPAYLTWRHHLRRAVRQESEAIGQVLLGGENALQACLYGHRFGYADLVVMGHGDSIDQVLITLIRQLVAAEPATTCLMLMDPLLDLHNVHERIVLLQALLYVSQRHHEVVLQTALVLLDHHHGGIRAAALELLRRFGPLPFRDAFIQGLRDEAIPVRYIAVRTFLDYPLLRSVDIIPQLQDWLHDRHLRRSYPDLIADIRALLLRIGGMVTSKDRTPDR